MVSSGSVALEQLPFKITMEENIYQKDPEATNPEVSDSPLTHHMNAVEGLRQAALSEPQCLMCNIGIRIPTLQCCCQDDNKIMQAKYFM